MKQGDKVKWSRRNKALVLGFRDEDKNYEILFSEDRYISGVNFWYDGDLIKGFGDPNYCMKEMKAFSRPDVQQAIEMYQAPAILAQGMELEFVKKSDLIEGYPNI